MRQRPLTLRRPTAVRCLLAMLFLLLSGGAAASAPAKRTLKLKRIKAERFMLCTHGPAHALIPGKAARIGSYDVKLAVEPKGARFTWHRAAEPPAGDQPSRSKRSGSKGSKFLPARKDRITLKLGTRKPVRSVHVFRDDLGTWHHMNPDALAVTVAGRTHLLFDADYDGTWLEPGVDWLALDGARHAVLCTKGMVVADQRWDEFRVEQGSLILTAEDLAAPLDDGDREAYRFLNYVRLYYGLPPALIEIPRSRKCALHAKWCAANKRLAHGETPGTPGFTKEGDEAGHASLVARGRSWTDALFDFFDTPLHGYDLCAPFFTRTALAWHEGFLAVWHKEEDDFRFDGPAWKRPAVFPPHGSDRIPLTWQTERPDPRRGDTSVRWGYPIRIYLQKTFRTYPITLKDLQVTLTPLAGGDPVPVQIEPQSDLFYVLPRVALKPRTAYLLRASWNERNKGPVSLRSTFTTGTKHGQSRSDLEH